MEDLSLHILDIVENSISASATSVSIEIIEDIDNDNILITISDNGKGMDEETIKKVFDPFYTTKNIRNFGFGIPLFAQTAQQCNGSLTINSKIGFGTTLTARLQRSHIDLIPLGDIGSTIVTLIISNPEIDYKLKYKKGYYVYEFESGELKTNIGIDGLLLPQTLKYIRDHINKGFENFNRDINVKD